MHRILLLLLIVLLTNATASFSQKKGKEDWRSSPLAMHDKMISQANTKRMASSGMLLVGFSLTLGGVAKYISPAFANTPKPDPRLIWLPVAGVLTTIAAYPIAKSSKKIRKQAWQILEQSASLDNQKQPFTRYPAVGLKISL